MNDVNIKYENGYFDLEISQVDLVGDNSLKNSCLISVFAYGRDDETSRYGYWGDALSLNQGDLTGSLLWKLSQNPNSQNNRLQMVDAIRGSLDWLITDSVVRSVEVNVDRLDRNLVVFKIEISRFVGENEVYDLLWKSTANKFEIR